LIWLGIGVFATYAGWAQEKQNIEFPISPIVAATALALFTVIRVFWPWLKSTQRRLAVWYGLHALRQATVGAAVTLSVVYLLLLTFSLPYRTDLEKQLDHKIAVGEMGAFRAANNTKSAKGK
jgi:hypothetical protein